MRWEDERYVRLYTRDTPAWVRLPWQARVVFYELSRKVDRAGIMPVDESWLDGVAMLLRLPDDVVAVGVEALLKDGCVVRDGDAIVIRNFIVAQETRQSDKVRKAVSRENAAARVQRKPSESFDVTNGHQESPGVTSDADMSPAVTSGHQESPPVTDGHSMPYRAVPCRAEEGCTSPAGDGSAAPAEAAPKKSRGPKPDKPDHPVGSLPAAVAAAVAADESLAPICKNPNTLASDLVAAAPGVDVVTEVRKAAGWLRANPERRKTKGNDFLLRWMGRAQERCGGRGQLPFSASQGGGGGFDPDETERQRLGKAPRRAEAHRDDAKPWDDLEGQARRLWGSREAYEAACLPGTAS